MKSWILTVVLMTAFILGGCNGIAGPEHGEPYLVLNGKITNEEPISTPDSMRVALLWANEEPEDNPHGILKVAQEAEINAEFPTFFKLSVDELPPKEAMMNPDEEMIPAGTKIALGAIIVYHDGNANHELDLLPEESTESVDTVLGVPLDIFLIYVEGKSFTVEENGITWHVEKGFNLVKFTSQLLLDACGEAHDSCLEQATNGEEMDACSDAYFDCVDEAEAQDPSRLLPLDTEIVINLTSDPRLARLLCQYSGLEEEGGGHEIIISDPDTWPESMEITCSEDGREFEYSWDEDYSTICHSSHSSGAGSLLWIPGKPLPEWWPCEEP